MVKGRIFGVILLCSVAIAPVLAQAQQRLVYGNITLSNVQIAAAPTAPGGQAGFTMGQPFDLSMSALLTNPANERLNDEARWYNAFPAVTRLAHSNAGASGLITDLSGSSAYVDAFLSGPGQWNFAGSSMELRTPLEVTPHTTITITGQINTDVSSGPADGDASYQLFLVLGGMFPNGTRSTYLEDRLYWLNGTTNMDQPFSLTLTNDTDNNVAMHWWFQGYVSASLVPEPASSVMLGAGFLMLAGYARRWTAPRDVKKKAGGA